MSDKQVKSIAIILGSLTAIAFLLYGMGAFIVMQPDVTRWQTFGRLVYVILWATSSVGFIAAYVYNYE